MTKEFSMKRPSRVSDLSSRQDFYVPFGYAQGKPAVFDKAPRI